ncbi:MAG: hypothetical protein ACKVXR_08495 [Planctomycetota bacterium]
MLAWTWQTWPDVLVGFGGELAVAWRLSEGEALYRDVAHPGGPLSAYANSLLFRVFGANLATLVSANLAVLAGIAALLHRLIEKIAGGFAAAAALVVFFALFAFAQFELVGSANWVCPYTHEATHGALLSLLAMLALDRWIESRRPILLAAVGLLLGLVFLTSVEIFVALAAAALLGLALGFVADRKGILRSLLALSIGAAVPVAVSFSLLATAMDAEAAWKGMLGAWPDFGVVLDRPRESGRLLLEWAGWWLAPILPAALLALAWRQRGQEDRGAVPFVIGALLAAVALLALRLPPGAWTEITRPLPLAAFLALAGTIVLVIRARDAAVRRRAILASTFALFALAMLAKTPLQARIGMQGFVLAMPATMLVVAVLVGWIPSFLDRLGGRGAFLRGAMVGVLGVAISAHLALQRTFLEMKTVTVGEGGDAFLADLRGSFVNAAVDMVRSKPGATLAVMPEGAMINYLARARVPVKHVDYLPPTFERFGEEAILADLQRAPPDLVAVTHRSTAEHGLPWFGEDYGAELMAFVREKYALGPLIGAEPLRPLTRFGIRLYALRR